MKYGLFTLVAFLGFTGCDLHKKQIKISDYQPQPYIDVLNTLRPNQIKIVDPNLAPVSEATVTIGLNSYVTDAEGNINIPQNWTDEQTVTIQKEGFISTSYLSQPPQKNMFIVRPRDSGNKYEVKGNTNGYPDLKKDGWVDFTLALKPFIRSDIVNFDIGKVISSEVDAMEALGQTLEIPSNISIPPQKESYLFFTLNLDKALYRVYYDTLGRKELIAHRGRFEVKPVVDKFRKGAAFYEVMNDLKFQSLETTKFELNGNILLDLNTNAMPLKPQFTHQAPAFDPATLYFTASMIKNGDVFVPTDYKFYKPNENQTMLLPTTPNTSYFLSMYGEKKIGADGKVKGLTPKMSLAFSSTTGKANVPLDVIPIPTISQGIATCVPPAKKIEVATLGTYAALSKVTTTVFETSYVDHKIVIWEVYAPSWVNQFQLPTQLTEHIEKTTEQSRFEVTYLGSSESAEAPLGPLQFSEATHASRNAIDFN